MRFVRTKGSPRTMGFQFGEQLRDVLADRLSRTITGNYVIETTSTGQKSHSLDQVSHVAEKFERAIEKRFPQFIDYMMGVSAGAHVKYEQLRTVAFGYLPPAECCCFAARGGATVDGRVIVGKNADNPPPVQDGDLTLVLAEPRNGFRYFGLTAFPELPGYFEGLNEKGVSIVGASAYDTRDGRRAYKNDAEMGIPIPLLQTLAYEEAESLDDAIKCLSVVPRNLKGRNLIVTDGRDAIAKAELSFEHTNVEKVPSSRNFLSLTNHFTSDEMADICVGGAYMSSSKARFERIGSLLAGREGPMNLEGAMSILKDHVNGPGDNSLCRHAILKTNGSIVIKPNEKRIWVAAGNPCVTPYESFSLA